MDTVEYNLDKICRACKGEAEELFSVFETEKASGRPSKLADMLMACASVQVEHGDGLPGSICMQCVDQLSNAYTFKKQCEKTDTSLRLYIRQKDIGVKEENAVNNTEIDNILDFNSIYNNEVSTPDDSKTIKTEPVENVADDDRTLLCNICNKKCSSTNDLKLHQQKHASVNIHKCKICSKEYFRLGHLQRHMVKHEPRRVHVCKLCNKTLTKVEHLKRHMITHVKNKPYGCETCRRGFNRPDHLMNHAKRCKGDKPFVCEICNKGFNREDSLQVHLSTHVAKVDMKPMLESLDNYEEHYVVVENYVGVSDLEEPDNCSDSDVISNVDWAEPEVNILEKPESESNITTLNQNIKYEEERLEENDGTNNDSKNEESDEESKPLLERIKTEVAVVSEVPIKRKRGRPRKTNVTPLKIIKSEKNGQENIMSIENKAKYPCDICDKVLSTLIGLEIHMRKHTGLKLFHCKVCNKKFTRSNHMKRHLLSHDEYKPFTCDICQKKFTRHEHLIKHSKSHASEKKFECEVCFKLFGRMEQLEKHKAFKHNIGEKMPTEKKYKCTVCNKHFTTEKYRDTHQKAHSGERTFECKTCLKKFKSKSHLTEHTKFHNECSKKFLCSECGQRFIRNDYLVIHMRRHRGEKPFKCKYCGKGFPRTTDLTVHERYHTGEKTHLCMVCGRGFGRAYNLTVHMRTHTGEKPYQCTYCDAAFAQGNDLKAHVRRHTGERYHCDLCSEAFLMGYLLTQHKRTVHGVDVKSHIRRLHPSERVHLPNSQHNTQINVKPISSLTQLQGLHNTATLQAQAEVPDDLQQISLPTPPILPTISHSVSDAVA